MKHSLSSVLLAGLPEGSFVSRVGAHQAGGHTVADTCRMLSGSAGGPSPHTQLQAGTHSPGQELLSLSPQWPAVSAQEDQRARDPSEQVT